MFYGAIIGKAGQRIVKRRRSVIAYDQRRVGDTEQTVGDDGGIVNRVNGRECDVQAIEVCQEEIRAIAVGRHERGIYDGNILGYEVCLPRQSDRDSLI